MVDEKNKATLLKIRSELQSKPIEHLLVDLDGTLLGENEFLSRIGFFSKAIPELSRLTQKSWVQVIRTLALIQKEFSRPNSPDGPNNRTRMAMTIAHGLGLTTEVADQVVQTVLQKVFPTLERHFFPYPGAREFLDWAKDHYPMTLATNPIWTQEYIKMRLKWANIPTEYFRWFSHSEIMWDVKPRKRYYQDVLALENLNPSRCLLIGNDPKRDLPAVELGISVFLISRSDRIESLHTDPGSASAWRGSYRILRLLLDKTATLD